jgi:putative hydrolase of the HAD superfamily
MTEEQRQALADTKVWLFDLDNTLYSAECRLFDQIHVRMRDYLMDYFQVGEEAAARIRRKYFLEHGTTLSGLIANDGIEPSGFLDYVHDIDLSPVKPNPALDAALARLPGRKLIFTNADTGHAENVMARLGVAHHFEAIFDIVDADYVCKPNPAPYAQIVADYGFPAGAAVMLDDMSVNLEPAAAMGMTTVWVRTHYSWSGDEAEDPDHVHHKTDDVTGWLEGVVPGA